MQNALIVNPILIIQLIKKQFISTLTIVSSDYKGLITDV